MVSQVCTAVLLLIMPHIRGFCFQLPSHECASLTRHLSVINKVQRVCVRTCVRVCVCVCVEGLRWWWGSLCQDKRGNDLAVTGFFLSATAQYLAGEQERLLFLFFFLYQAEGSDHQRLL